MLVLDSVYGIIYALIDGIRDATA